MKVFHLAQDSARDLGSGFSGGSSTHSPRLILKAERGSRAALPRGEATLMGSPSFLAALRSGSCVWLRGRGTPTEGLKAVFGLPCSAVAAGRAGGLAGRRREAWARSARRPGAPRQPRVCLGDRAATCWQPCPKLKNPFFYNLVCKRRIRRISIQVFVCLMHFFSLI